MNDLVFPIFQSLSEIEEFLHTKTVQYIQDWIAIWYPFFKKGIEDGQKQAINSVCPITYLCDVQTQNYGPASASFLLSLFDILQVVANKWELCLVQDKWYFIPYKKFENALFENSILN